VLPQELGGSVDPNLMVYGTANLRVLDASVMPMEVSSHLTAPTFGVAKMAADIIKKSNKDN
jgi:choline dehydrogenase